MKFLAYEFVSLPLIGAAIFILSYLYSNRLLEFLSKRSLGNREYVLEKLDLMFVEVDKRKVTWGMLLLSFGLGFVFFLLFFPNLFLGFLFGGVVTILGWSIPRWLIDYLYAKRCGTFVNQMVDSLTIMANSISAGLTVPQAMERVTDKMPPPISQEFSLVLSQVRLGLSVEEALNGLATRIPAPDLQMFVLAINILKETGGNLAETFATIVETLRERQKVEKKIEALTAQGIMQGIIITLVPFLLLIMFLIIDPGYVKPMFTTAVGVIFLLLMLILQILGGLAIRKIVKIRV